LTARAASAIISHASQSETAMNLITIHPSELDAENRVSLRGRRARHVVDVLGKTAGQQIRTGLLHGMTGTGTVESINEQAVVIRCAFDEPPVTEPAMDLVLALPRPKVMKRLWAQLSAIGVRRIYLTNAARVERNYFDTHWLEAKHFTPLLIEGLEQSGATRPPEVRVVRRLKPFVEDEADSLLAQPRFVAHPGAEHRTGSIAWEHTATLAIGPEGGWTPFELGLFERLGFTPFALGHRILRSDTACIALLGALQAACTQSMASSPGKC
jgi:RsmE family RNA methyltransferase